MQLVLVIISTFVWSACFTQKRNIIGTFTKPQSLTKFEVAFNADSTFEYISTEHPTFFRYEDFSEKGRWTISNDTVILNPQLEPKPYVESDLREEETRDTNLLLTFNHIKRYFNNNGMLLKSDTVQILRLDFAFNEYKKKRFTRVATYPTVCFFAGYVPKQVITTKRTVSFTRPNEELKSIIIGCYELQGMKEFAIKNHNSNHFILNVYSNYYLDGQIRQMKFLIKNDNVLYTKQRANGTFEKENFWSLTSTKLKRKTTGG
jgi:hypothetical protein